MSKSKSRQKQIAPVAAEPEALCLCPECVRERLSSVMCREMLLSNPSDFAVEGELRIVRTHHSAPVFMIDDVCLSELVRFHYKPEETCEGYLLGRVQVLIIPVNE